MAETKNLCAQIPILHILISNVKSFLRLGCNGDLTR